MKHTPAAPSAGNFRHCVVVHYAEIGLKGGNRSQFENQLRRNIKKALSRTNLKWVERSFGRFLLFFEGAIDRQTVAEQLGRVFGIAHFSPAIITEQDMDAITAAALREVEGKNFASFRVTTRRAQKEFRYNSQEISTIVGAAIQKKTGVRVDLRHPELTCYIEIFNNNALIYAEKIKGPGGLPVGVSEKAVALLSSGIDSPVASWKMMKRGVKVIFVHFHSAPATTRASIENTRKLVQLLTGYQYNSRLYLVPFLPVQQKIMLDAPAGYRVLLYRRSMFRLAEAIARKEKATALVTGESVGQVASQTLSNIRVINEVVSLPVLRPLIGEDKIDITELAQRIGTFRISTEPYEDCCSLFVPRHPETRANPERIRAVEEQLNLEPLYREALQAAEIEKFRYPEREENPQEEK